MKALRDVQQKLNTTVIIVTHNMDVATQMDRLITLVDGHVATDADANVHAHAAAIEQIKQKRATGPLPALTPQ